MLQNSELAVHVIIFPWTMSGASLIMMLGFEVVLAYLGAVANKFIMQLLN